MRSFRTSALILTLIMLLLVLVAAFVFLFQMDLRLRSRVLETQAEADQVRQLQAETELQLGAAEATRDASSSALATAEHSGLLLEGQLVESQQEVDSLTATIEAFGTRLEEAESDLAELEEAGQSRPPMADIVQPEDGATLQTGQSVTIVVVASDPNGLERVQIMVDGRVHGTYTLNGERLFTRTTSWSAPNEEGVHTIELSAVNANGIASNDVTIEVTLANVEARNEAIRARVEANVLSLRGLELLEPVEPLLLTEAQLQERVEVDVAENLSPEEARQDALVFSAFDFVERDFDLHEALVELRGQAIAGFYDPETAEFVVISDDTLLDPAEQWTHAHEFVHALQDQHYALEGISDDSLDSEARAAIRALAEGEAELVQLLYIREGYFTNRELDAIRATLEENEEASFQAFPSILLSDLAFPYLAGSAFAGTLYEAGGFAALNDAWESLPQTTEHILHPDRYLAGDRPQLVTLSPLTDTLGVGWEQIDEDVFGEFYLREYLAQQLDTADVERAATGWGGDRYVVHWNEASEQLVMALKLVWDRPEDAAEFAEVYPAYPSSLLGSEQETQPDGGQCWQNAEVICFYDDGRTSLIVRAPDLALAATVAAALR
jgi:hypothetical protein